MAKKPKVVAKKKLVVRPPKPVPAFRAPARPVVVETVADPEALEREAAAARERA